MKTIAYATGNVLKFESAVKAFRHTSIELVQVKLDPPEIQSESVEAVAKYAAKWACEQLGKPVMVTDAGLHIEALNGFPGPFVKFVNGWFTEYNYVNLMKGQTNRKAQLMDCLAFCRPGEVPVVFTGYYEGYITEQPCGGGRTPMDRIFVPEGFDKPIAMIPEDEMTAYWSRGAILSQFVTYIRAQKDMADCKVVYKS